MLRQSSQQILESPDGRLVVLPVVGVRATPDPFGRSFLHPTVTATDNFGCNKNRPDSGNTARAANSGGWDRTTTSGSKVPRTGGHSIARPAPSCQTLPPVATSLRLNRDNYRSNAGGVS